MTPVITTCAALAACTTAQTPVVDQGEFTPDYGSVTTKLLADDLVSFDVEMSGARNDDDVIAFNDCAAAQYALIRGAGFVRRVRNDISKKRGVWHGTGVYTLSEAHPGGRYSIDAEVTASQCRADNIPTV